MTSRRRWAPISRDDDPTSQARRLSAVERDVLLHGTGAPCPGCRQKGRLSGGEGCGCSTTSGARLTARCEALADRARRDGAA